MERYLMWSGGKDSSASIVICYENGIHLDGVVMSEVMFDHSRNISGEDIEHITWVKNVAIPIIEKMGYKVYLLRDDDDYLSMFHKTITRSKKPNRIGKKVGFFVAGMCVGNSRLKMRPINKFLKEHKDCEQIVGIAFDEADRMERLKTNHKNRRSVLFEYGVVEEDTYEMCRKYNLLSPIYNNSSRGGCWFCPNSKTSEFAKLKLEHPELWAELHKLSKEDNLLSTAFKYNKTFEQVNAEVDAYIQERENQIKIEVTENE